MSDELSNEGVGTETATETATQAGITSLDQIPQNLRNQLEAQHKRGLQKQLAEAQQKLSHMSQLQNQTAQMLEMFRNNGIEFDEGSDLDDLASQLTGTLDGLKTEKEKAEAASKKQAELLAAAQKQANDHLAALHETLVMNELGRELVDRAVSPKAAELISRELQQFAQVGDDRKVAFKMDVTDENGHTAPQAIDAKTAVQLLESNADWRHFFKATVNAGAGGEVVNGVKRGSDGGVDLNALLADPAKFMEIMDKNPKLLDGLKFE